MTARRLLKITFQVISRMVLVIIIMGVGIALYQIANSENEDDLPSMPVYVIESAQDAAPTIPPNTPLPTFTPSQTLKPPPTLEPPTPTPQPSLTPSATPTATIDTSVSVPGLHGAATPTTVLASSSGTGGGGAAPAVAEGVCEPREDWGGVYVVKMNDALATIAAQYGLTMFDLAQGNCLEDMNLIVVGQELRVPGAGTGAGGGGAAVASQAQVSSVSSSCAPWELVIPVNNTINVGGDGTISFEWRGPEAFRYLLRIIEPNGSTFESVFDIRQNETIDASDLPLAGTYTWYVYPLDENFQQIGCSEGGPWTFTKGGAPTATPTVTPQPPTPNFLTNVTAGAAPLEVQFVNQSSGEVDELLWSFGDSSNWGGTPQTAGHVSHVYNNPGEYLVTLWVKGPGGESTTSRFITVR